MTDDRDTALTRLFAEADEPADGDAFTHRVVTHAVRSRRLALAGWIAGVLLILAALWWLALPLEVARLLAGLLSAPLLDLGDGWVGLFASPINSIAAVLAVALRLGFLLRRRFSGVVR